MYVSKGALLTRLYCSKACSNQGVGLRLQIPDERFDILLSKNLDPDFVPLKQNRRPGRLEELPKVQHWWEGAR